MAHSSNDYQKSYLRVYRASADSKESVRTTIHEILKLQFEAQYHLNRLKLREKTVKPLPINPLYQLTKNNVRVNSPYVVKGFDDTYFISVSEKTHSFLIPFYRDVALEFYTSNKGAVSLLDVEAHVKDLQPLSFKQLEDAKKRLEKLKRDSIFYRINQESRKAQEHFEGIWHKFGEEDIKTSEQTGNIWKSLMKKLRIEGYEFFPATLAANVLMRILTLYESNVTADEGIVSHEMHYPTVKIDDNKELFEWSTVNKPETMLEELIYTKYRLEELAEDKRFKKWEHDVIELMQFYRKHSYTKEEVIIELCKRRFDKKHIDKALEIFEDTPLKLTSKPKNKVTFVTKQEEKN